MLAISPCNSLCSRGELTRKKKSWEKKKGGKKRHRRARRGRSAYVTTTRKKIHVRVLCKYPERRTHFCSSVRNVHTIRAVFHGFLHACISVRTRARLYVCVRASSTQRAHVSRPRSGRYGFYERRYASEDGRSDAFDTIYKGRNAGAERVVVA